MPSDEPQPENEDNVWNPFSSDLGSMILECPGYFTDTYNIFIFALSTVKIPNKLPWQDNEHSGDMVDPDYVKQLLEEQAFEDMKDRVQELIDDQKYYCPDYCTGFATYQVQWRDLKNQPIIEEEIVPDVKPGSDYVLDGLTLIKRDVKASDVCEVVLNTKDYESPSYYILEVTNPDGTVERYGQGYVRCSVADIYIFAGCNPKNDTTLLPPKEPSDDYNIAITDSRPEKEGEIDVTNAPKAEIVREEDDNKPEIIPASKIPTPEDTPEQTPSDSDSKEEKQEKPSIVQIPEDKPVKEDQVPNIESEIPPVSEVPSKPSVPEIDPKLPPLELPPIAPNLPDTPTIIIPLDDKLPEGDEHSDTDFEHAPRAIVVDEHGNDVPEVDVEHAPRAIVVDEHGNDVPEVDVEHAPRAIEVDEHGNDVPGAGVYKGYGSTTYNYNYVTSSSPVPMPSASPSPSSSPYYGNYSSGSDT